MIKRSSILVAAVLCVSSCHLTDSSTSTKFTPLFTPDTLSSWHNHEGYSLKDGVLAVGDNARYMVSPRDYANYVLRFDFKLNSGANNGIGVRCPAEGDPCFTGMELQVLEDTADCYKGLTPKRCHAAITTVQAPLKRAQHAPGEWNHQQIRLDGNLLTITLNGEVIQQADLSQLKPTDKRMSLTRPTGRIIFCGHGSGVWFRNIEIMELPSSDNHPDTK